MYPHERSLVKRLAGEPFVLLGINSDDSPDTLRKVIADEEMTWRSWFDGPGTSGPIASRWNVTGWPTIYVLDHEGVIRFKDLRGTELDTAVDRLLAEMNAR